MNNDFRLMERLIRYCGTWRKQSGADEWQAAINQGRRQQDTDFSLVVLVVCIVLAVVTSYLVVIYGK